MRLKIQKLTPESSKSDKLEAVEGKVPPKKPANRKKTNKTKAIPQVNNPIKKLEPKQEKFCLEYLLDLNATQAAIRAGYSEKSARQQGAENLSKPAIQERIAELKKAQFKRLEIESDTLLREALRIATADVGLAFNPDGSLKAIHDIPEDIRRAISGFEVEELFAGNGKDRLQIGTLKKVKFWSKDKNIETLMKHKGLFGEDNKQKNEALTSLLGLIDGSSSGKLPSPDEAGE